MVTERLKQYAQRRKRGKSRATPDEAEGRSLNRAQRSVGEQFASALIEIDKALRMRSEKTPMPAWANAEEYALSEEERFKAQVNQIDESIAELQQEKIQAERSLDSAGNLRA